MFALDPPIFFGLLPLMGVITSFEADVEAWCPFACLTCKKKAEDVQAVFDECKVWCVLADVDGYDLSLTVAGELAPLTNYFLLCYGVFSIYKNMI